ncbi:hypothetical protein BDF14DRAFT_1779768 [Spinellus fusiger]|nr:hypothetical protein BDF14DRAFT_1779768 [Spinellus fusiger]
MQSIPFFCLLLLALFMSRNIKSYQARTRTLTVDDYFVPKVRTFFYCKVARGKRYCLRKRRYSK